MYRHTALLGRTSQKWVNKGMDNVFKMLRNKKLAEHNQKFKCNFFFLNKNISKQRTKRPGHRRDPDVWERPMNHLDFVHLPGVLLGGYGVAMGILGLLRRGFWVRRRRGLRGYGFITVQRGFVRGQRDILRGRRHCTGDRAGFCFSHDLNKYNMRWCRVTKWPEGGTKACVIKIQ